MGTAGSAGHLIDEPATVRCASLALPQLSRPFRVPSFARCRRIRRRSTAQIENFRRRTTHSRIPAEARDGVAIESTRDKPVRGSFGLSRWGKYTEGRRSPRVDGEGNEIC